ncbi:hypothetical protein [Microbacterium album]|uniref:Uncharacterized protein n=1 Tax=Microbacterium album TaxID=2053191 RepID=A0A917MMA5_9MICO|nr:hypothetical protein [Microbacterium album]GGH34025.1 hypothetical protein GCM10010921_01410 [Microbacterium album]
MNPWEIFGWVAALALAVVVAVLALVVSVAAIRSLGDGKKAREVFRGHGQ